MDNQEYYDDYGYGYEDQPADEAYPQEQYDQYGAYDGGYEQYDQYDQYEQYEQPVQPEQPAQPEKKPVKKKSGSAKKSLRRNYGRIALVAMAVAFVLLILLLRVTAINRVKASRESKLLEAYERYTSGDTAAADDIRKQAEDYDVANMTIALIDQLESAQAAANVESFGGESDEPAEPGAEATDEATTPDATGEAADSQQEEAPAPAVQEDAEVTAARQLWASRDYAGAKAAFDDLAAKQKLSFDVTTAAYGDEVLMYGAVCSMLSLYRNVSTKLYFSDVLVYDYTPVLAVSGYDFEKPVYYFSTDTGDFVCAYSTETDSYTYWSKNAETVTQVIAGDKYDLLSISTALDIRKILQ